MLHLLLISVVLCLQSADGGVLIWGAESIRLPSLKQFNNEDFDLLKSYMRRPKVLVFHGDPLLIADDLQELLRNKYTAYVPSSSLTLDDVIELNNDAKSNFRTIETMLYNCSREYNNILALIVSTGDATRHKREVIPEDEQFSSTEVPEVVTEVGVFEPAIGIVLYKGKTKTHDSAMVYSSKTPVLRINTTTYSLGKATVETVDDRDKKEKYRQLSVTIPMEANGKVTLRFNFMWLAYGYWSLNTVILVNMNSKQLTLSARQSIQSARKFSYHCTGTAVFENAENEVSLTLYDIQAQPDAANDRFDDAFDCVHFTTAPIWSGLMVVALMIVVLFIGLGALNSIKTMDKFDSNKSKQLTITMVE